MYAVLFCGFQGERSAVSLEVALIFRERPAGRKVAIRRPRGDLERTWEQGYLGPRLLSSCVTFEAV